MKRRTRFQVWILLVGVLVTGQVGCVDLQQVRDIVAETNAAIVDAPMLLQAGEGADDSWKDAVRRIDTIIAKNPDQKALVNSLRVRQAMLLTVYKQMNLAKETWKLIDEEGLSERDKAFLTLYEDIIWWFEAAATPVFGNKQISRARVAARHFDTVCDGLTTGSDIRNYLEVMRASMVLKADNKSPTNSDALKKQVAGQMAEDAKRLVNTFDKVDKQWIEAHPNDDAKPEDMPLERLRAQVWFRDLLKNYRQVAKDKGLSPAWDPEWIGSVAFNLD